MRTVIAQVTPQPVDKPVHLGKLVPGQAFRMASIPFEQAVEENLFFLVVNAQPTKPNRVTVMALDGQSVLERDNDHMVVQHDYDLHVYREPRK